MLQRLLRIYDFYRDGFRQMTIGKRLWKIILIKLFVLFAVLKLFFFPNFLSTRFETDADRGNYVGEQLTKPVITEMKSHQPMQNGGLK